MTTFGYYTTVQCAPAAGDERLNIGVLGYDPGTGALDIHFGAYRRRLGAQLVDPETLHFLDQEVDSLRAWVRLWAGRLTLERLRDVLAQSTGIVRFATLRPMAIRDFEQDLVTLVQRALGQSAIASPRKGGVHSLLATLDERFKSLEDEQRLHFRTRVHIPDVDVVMPVHYHFKNGHDTYIIAESFGGRKRDLLDRAATLAVRGKLLSDRTHGASQLAVVLAYDDDETRTEHDHAIRQVFQDHAILVVSVDELDAFVATVQQDARPW